MDTKYIDKHNIVDYLADVFLRRSADSYLGEQVTMSNHMLQTALNAQQDGQSDELICAALLHGVGHYSRDFPEDYIERGIDNYHQLTGSAILKKFFPESITQPIRWHVDAKRYLCVKNPAYLTALSTASVATLKLQGGPLT